MATVKIVGKVNLDSPVTKDDIKVSRSGAYGSGWVHFECDQYITKDRALELQMQLGYHPCGYGFYSYRTDESGTKWQCSGSCD